VVIEPYVPEQFLTLAEVAQRLRMTSASVRRWIRAGQLPAEKVGLAPSFRYRVRAADLAVFLDRSATRP
jgi:excisionase family DNA binding protein